MAQSFVDPGKLWTAGERITDGVSYSDPKTVFYRFDGDSLYNEVIYDKMYYKENTGSWEFHSLWREDNDDNVYCIWGTTETKVYNFSMNEGEVFNEEDDCPVIIDSIRMEEFGNESRKFLYVHYGCVLAI